MLFGPNSLDIRGKSTVSLLVDEVGRRRMLCPATKAATSGHPPVLRIPNREHHSVVTGRLLLLCVLHRFDFVYQYRNHFDRYEEGRVFNPFVEDDKTKPCFTDHHTYEGDVAVLLPRERAYRWRM